MSCTFLCSLGSVTLSVRAVPHTTRFVAAQRERLALTLSLASRRASERGGSLSLFSLLLYCGRPVDEQERETHREREREILLTAALVCSEPVPMADDDDDCTRQH